MPTYTHNAQVNNPKFNSTLCPDDRFPILLKPYNQISQFNVNKLRIYAA